VTFEGAGAQKCIGIGFALEFEANPTHVQASLSIKPDLSVLLSIVQKHNKSSESVPLMEVPNCANCRQRHLSICAAFGEHELVSFDRVVLHKTLPAKTVLFEQGNPADFVFSVSDGTVRLFRLLPDGRRQIIGFAIKGDFLGTAMSEKHDYTAEAVDAIKVCRIPRPAFQTMLDEKPHLLKKLHEIAGREIHTSQDQIVLLGRKNAEERVAAFLLSYRERLARVFTLSVHVPLPMSRQDIADYLGLTIETVSRTISKLAREKLVVVVPDGIRVLDLDRLIQLSDG
jgi:CRP/FNR family transcriptional regulator, anaerobic regulatory protein